jgi:hypothetical protein
MRNEKSEDVLPSFAIHLFNTVFVDDEKRPLGQIAEVYLGELLIIEI